MSKKVYHRSEAMGILKVQDGNLSAIDGYGRIAIAQVHATLYLADQQRIANLIAVFGDSFTSKIADDSSFLDLRATIREGLGI